MRPRVAVSYYIDEYLESVPEERVYSAFDKLRGMPLRDATMIVQSCLLGASYQDIADYHGTHKMEIVRVFKKLRKNNKVLRG